MSAPTIELTTWQEVEERLRARDDDQAYADAPVLDAYARISKNPNTGEMEKTDRQLLDILTNIEKRHARLGEILRDDNVSAWKLKGKRPAWKRLLARQGAGDAKGAVAWHLDRLLRQPIDLEMLINLSDTGRILGTCFGDYDLSNHDHRLTLRIITGAAVKECDNLSKRQKRKHEARRMSGISFPGGRRPFGYPGAGTDPALVEAEREAVARAIQDHVDGTELMAIARRWNARGLRTTGKAEIWGAVSVRAVLERPRNAGLMRNPDGTLRPARDIEPIVSPELYGRLCAVLEARGRGRQPSAAYFLSGGCLKCAECGRGLTGGKSDGKRYYRCPPGKPGTCAAAVTINADNVEEFAREQTLNVLSDPAHATQVARKSAALKKVEDEIEQCERTARELGKRLSDPSRPMSFERYEAATAPLDARIATLSAERDALLVAGAGQSADPRSLAELADVWASATADERRRMVQRAFPYGLAVYPAVKRRGPVSDRVEPIVSNA